MSVKTPRMLVRAPMGQEVSGFMKVNEVDN
jgi:hypothetical protein